MKVSMLLIAVSLVGFTSCKKCDGENPTSRVLNNCADTISVNIISTGGDTVNIYNLATGQFSDYATYAPGTADYTITVGNGGIVPTLYTSVVMQQCFQYNVVLESDYDITVVPTDLNE
ncbi:MAG: hypothetical protein QNK23_12145 [Crocinitomicaceae bacterium]|nr:hypothetical protein [Crocinitomicaceae bacterium]